MQRSSLSRSFLSSSRVGGDLDTSIVLNDSLSIDSKQTKLEEKVASFLASGAIEVSFSDTHLQDAGCVIVCAALKEKDAAHVVSLNLRGNAIALSGTLALCELLRAHAGLRSLCLEWNDLGKENSMDKLADALCLNRTLAYVCNSYINLSLSCFCKCIGVLLLLDLLFYLRLLSSRVSTVGFAQQQTRSRECTGPVQNIFTKSEHHTCWYVFHTYFVDLVGCFFLPDSTVMCSRFGGTDLRWNKLLAAGGRLLAEGMERNARITELLLAGNHIPVDIVQVHLALDAYHSLPMLSPLHFALQCFLKLWRSNVIP
jgi:hypothetical protein